MSKSLRAALFLAMLVTPSLILAQNAPPDFHWCTLNIGYGYSTVGGTDGSNLSGRWNLDAGAGFSVINQTKTRPWSLFLNFDYLFDETSVKTSALSAAKNLNPTDIPLLNASGGTTRFNVVAFDPTFRYRTSSRTEIYGFAGFGWFRRGVDLTGISSQGALLQPGSPSVFLRDSGSGSIDAGGGINFRTWKKLVIPYVEVRVVHGLAVNSTTTLVPFSAGIRW